MFGTFDRLAVEFDFAPLADYERFWAEVFKRPKFAETLGRWSTLVETSGSNELWRVAE